MILLLGWVLADLRSDLDAVVNDPKLDGAIAAAQVSRLDGEPIYGHLASTRVMPASNQKLLSVCFAMDHLGPNYVPDTKIWVESDRVVIDTEGNPELSYDQLIEARNKLKLDGKKRVEVRQAYRPLIPPSWELDDLPNRYAAPVTALTVDRGSFELWSEQGSPVLKPTSFGARIYSWHSDDPVTVRYQPYEWVVRVYGDVPMESKRLDTLAIPEPDVAAGSVFGWPVRPTESVPSRAPDLVIKGRPLIETIRDCLHRSDNNYAENLMLMAAASEGPLGKDPYATASSRLRKFLTNTVKGNAADLQPQDGSGMSRHDIVTARGIVALLQWASKQTWGQLFRSSLAKPGVGTLASRLAGSSFQGKTGSLDMVSSLSGYVKGADGSDLVVSFILNHYRCSTAEARGFLDKFIRVLEGPAKVSRYDYRAWMPDRRWQLGF